MNNKRMFLIGLGVLLVFGLLVIVLKTTSQSSSSNPVHLATISNENKIYTVQEVVDILKSNRTVLKDKSIQLEAFVVDAVEGLGCQDYQIITDKEYVQTFKNRYDNKLSQEERFNAILQSKLAPVLQTGEALTVPEGFFPTYHAIYQGHFYDPKMTKNCDADAFKKFVIERKVKEIVATKQSNYRTKTFSTGIIIANGKYLQRPYEVTLKDYKVTVNGVLYEPATEVE